MLLLLYTLSHLLLPLRLLPLLLLVLLLQLAHLSCVQLLGILVLRARTVHLQALLQRSLLRYIVRRSPWHLLLTRLPRLLSLQRELLHQ